MAVLGLVPFVGSFLGGILVTGTTFASVGRSAGLIALGIFLLYQQMEGNLLQPLIQRRTLKMNPLLIALVMLLGTEPGRTPRRPVGLPIASAVQVLFQDQLTRLSEGGGHGRRDGKSRLILPSTERAAPREAPPSRAARP